MKSKNKDFIKLLEDLCFIYTDYLKRYDSSRLEVLIEDNSIKMNLYNSNEIVDSFGLVFNQKEKNNYTYVSIVLMKMLFGSRVIYSRDNMFCNDIDNSNLIIVVNDRDLFNRMFNMVTIRRDMDFYDKIDNGRRIRNKINKKSVVSSLEERVGFTRKLLKDSEIK